MMVRRIAAALALLMAVALAPLSLRAQELRIGLVAEPGTLDPHFHNLPANNQIALHMFEALVAQDAAQNLVPALAQTWTPLDDRTWEFRLRPDVTFHDGSPFTAEDVVFSIERAARVPNAPAPFTWFTRHIAGIDVIDPLTLRVRTANPAPLLPRELSAIRILSKRAASGPAPEGKTTDQLNRGEGLIGTGPFRFVTWSRGEQLVVERNDSYWGPKPAWQRVIFRPVPNPTVRINALLSGDLDVAESPPAADLPNLAGDSRVVLARTPSHRVFYIHFDQFAEPSPGIPDTGGRNPLKDRRVREALALALDRSALVQQILAGFAVPAAELLPSPMFGTREGIPVQRPDRDRARRLLREAGYPDGFSLLLGTASGRYLHDTKLAEAIAAQWTAIGVRTHVEALAPQAFAKNRDEYRYSAYVAAYATTTGEMSEPLHALVATPNPERGAGWANKGRYSNPAVDAALSEALRTVDTDKRRALLQEASRLAMDDFAVLPLFFEAAVWALRPGLTYPGRADYLTLAQHVVPRP
jgi:peptide/nickel transport system substrate-binding protein